MSFIRKSLLFIVLFFALAVPVNFLAGAKGALVSTDQAEYIRIKANCTKVRAQAWAMAGGYSSYIDCAIYEYLISENSLTAKRVLEEMIATKEVNDLRKHYRIAS
jgi:hypothetical protein